MVKQSKITQPVEEKPPVIDYSTLPDHYHCPLCQEWKFKDSFYWYKRYKQKNKETKSAYCRKCTGVKYTEEYKQKQREKGGSWFVYSKPGLWGCDEQKKQTFEMLQTFGYIYNEERNIWLKPGIKELDENGKVIFPKVVKQKRKRTKLTKQDYRKIEELHRQGYDYKKIARLLDRNPSTVYKRIERYESTLKTSRH